MSDLLKQLLNPNEHRVYHANGGWNSKKSECLKVGYTVDFEDEDDGGAQRGVIQEILSNGNYVIRTHANNYFEVPIDKIDTASFNEGKRKKSRQK